MRRYLMDQLIECVLAICTRLTPNNWAGIEVDTLASFGNAFSITFHIALLEISSETMHILVVW